MKSAALSFASRYLDLTDEEASAVGELDLVASYAAGTCLVEQGSRSRASYLVVEGIIRYHATVDGVDKTTDFFVEGEAVEPTCVADGSPSTHHVSCVEDCVLFASTPEIEARVMAQFPRFEKVCRLAAEDALRANRQTLQSFQLSTVQERYEHLLWTRPSLVQRVPQYMIASYLGVEPESLSRIRGRMART